MVKSYTITKAENGFVLCIISKPKDYTIYTSRIYDTWIELIHYLNNKPVTIDG